MSRKKAKGQLKIFNELEKQFLIQAERLGIQDRYSPIKIKEIEYEALKKHMMAFYAERANLEYEMQMLGSNKKETLIKLERLEVYIKRAERMKENYEKLFNKAFEGMLKEGKIANETVNGKKISVLVGGQ